MEARKQQVWFVPYSPGNPYQPELARELGRIGWKVADRNAGLREIIRELMPGGRRRAVLHLHWLPTFPASPAGWMRGIVWVAQIALIRALGGVVVWTVHNLCNHESGDDAVERWVSRRVFGLSSGVIAHSDAAREMVVREFGAGSGEGVVTIPHGSYLGVYPNVVRREEARRKLELPDEARVLLFFGQVRPYKGVESLLEDFRGVAGGHLRLVVAGRPLDAGVEDEVRRAAGDDPRISLHLRYIPDDEIQTFMNAADAVVFPYRDILTSGAVVLAMSFGRACIAPRLGGIPEMLGADGGVLYDPDDAAGLREALDQAGDPAADLEAMGSRNLAEARQLGWDRIAAATGTVYTAAIDGAQPAGSPGSHELRFPHPPPDRP